ncbi:MAG TPA: hypothetical protein VNC84_08060 [Gammaproteobacteria bacterium]|jgi:intracellular multiplication protein IcmC|nr:hypothetical protein [Gammaproteobacteria bacterium]
MPQLDEIVHRCIAPINTERFRLLFVFFAFLSLFPPPALAVEVATLSVADMLINIGKQIPNITQLVKAFAFVAGFLFVINGVIKLKHAGEMRTQMSYEHSMLAPLVKILVGAMLIYLPSALQMGTVTFFADMAPYAYVPPENNPLGSLLKAGALIIQLFGTIAFIRGLMILGKLGTQGGHQGGIGKAVTHLIGGICCLNIYQFIGVISNTLGIHTG